MVCATSLRNYLILLKYLLAQKKDIGEEPKTGTTVAGQVQVLAACLASSRCLPDCGLLISYSLSDQELADLLNADDSDLDSVYSEDDEFEFPLPIDDVVDDNEDVPLAHLH
ncbi:hypothetical protein QE152_g3749 [Popillia japonica]|uniref:Uncharacterized protein n=1 Tax=Popillia japonica TaxID=7064 RepID=A0AAW1N3A9_POPJA